MQVSKGVHMPMEDKTRIWTEDNMQADFAYEMAQYLTDSLFAHGMISKVEAEQIKQLNREKFHPFYKELLG